MKAIAFFNNKGGVGKTPLVYHLAWMYQELGVRVLAVDLDPQAHLTWAFLPKSKVEAMWMDSPGILQAVQDFRFQRRSNPGLNLEEFGEHLAFLAGHLELSLLENAAGQDLEQALREIIRSAGEQHRAEVALVDLGPNLAALNRAAVLACEHFVIPLRADGFAAVSLNTLSHALREWKTAGRLSPLGYTVFQLPVRRAGRGEWLRMLASAYHREVLDEIEPTEIPDPDPYCLATLRPYVSLSGLAEQAHKPMFLLKPADGAIGGHSEAVQDCYRDFKALALRIAAACGILSETRLHSTP